MDKIVPITDQSFRDAGAKEIFLPLTMEKIIYGDKILETGEVEAMEKADRALEEKAFDSGISHVFNVRHKLKINGHPDSNSYWCFAYGTGYS